MPDAEQHAPIAAKVERYYTAKLAEHGTTPRGVDWNSTDSQELRFVQLARLLPARGRYSITDVGCGYGALVEYLEQLGHDFAYQGYDLSERMIAAARKRYGGRAGVRFTAAPEDLEPTDYAVASGIFNVRLDIDPERWERYVQDILDHLRAVGRLGFAFNMLTGYSDPNLMRDDLYYPDPCAIFDRCKQRYARNVALLHDYDLWEFTVIVRTGVDLGSVP